MTRDNSKMQLPARLALTRRRVLIALAAIASTAQSLHPESAWAATEDDAFLRISKVITGNDSLSPDIATRIQHLLAGRHEHFLSKMADLAGVMQQDGGSRDHMLSKLTDTQVKFALEIAKPWYLGYLGTPSNFVLKDDAVFATFLEAQSYQKVIGEVPRPTYPDGSAGWWNVPPNGVNAPDMPEQITSWTFHPGGPSEIMAPDPKWKAYATADHAGIEEARQQKPGATSSTGDK